MTIQSSKLPLVLRVLKAEDEASFRRAILSFRASDPAWNFALGFDEDAPFSDYLRALQEGSKRETHIEHGRVPSSYFVAVSEDIIVGRVSLRHVLSPKLRDFGGHVGFGVVLEHRQNGFGREMLLQALPYARALGLTKLLITCSDKNEPSIRIIESCGGAFEDTRPRPGGGLTRRYWLRLT